MIDLRYGQRAAQVETDPVLQLKRRRDCGNSRFVEIGVSVQIAGALKPKERTMIGVLTALRDDAHLGGAKPGIGIRAGYRHIELAHGVDGWSADGEKAACLHEVVGNIDAVLGDVGGVTTLSMHKNIANS